MWSLNTFLNFFFFRQNALLATISEKDANIALLELSPTVGSDTEVRKFKAEKDKLVNELKEQVIWVNSLKLVNNTSRLKEWSWPRRCVDIWS